MAKIHRGSAWTNFIGGQHGQGSQVFCLAKVYRCSAWLRLIGGQFEQG